MNAHLGEAELVWLWVCFKGTVRVTIKFWYYACTTGMGTYVVREWMRAKYATGTGVRRARARASYGVRGIT